MKKLIVLTILGAAFSVQAQTTNAPVVLETNKVSVVLTADQWKQLRQEWRVETRASGQTNLTFSAWQDRIVSGWASWLSDLSRQRIAAVLNKLAVAQTNDTKVDNALDALK